MSGGAGRASPLELWGGVECTVNRVGDRWFDQMIWSGHDRRADDLDRFASLGIRAIRYPILWERTAPRSLDELDWRWSDERLWRLRALNVRPILGLLHHGSGPGYTSLLDERFAEKLAVFAGAVARRYPWVIDYTPVNEPLTTARFSALYGHWYPHTRSDRDFIRALLNQLKAVVLAMRAVRESVPEARLVQTEDCGRTFGRRATREQVAFEAHRRWLTWDFLAGRVDDRHPLHRFLTRNGMTAADEAFFLEQPCAPAVLGLNYYVTSDRYLDDRCARYPRDVCGDNGFVAYADVEAVRVRPSGIAGHETHLTTAWKRYGIPVAITEAHLGCTREEQLRWLMEAWEGARAARARGADVRAVTAWALLGSHNWHSLVTRDDGHYEPGAFDVRAPAPRPTALAQAVRGLTVNGVCDHPVLWTRGWWHRPTRRLHLRRRNRAASTTGVPTLVIAGSSRLARSFQRICVQRGLACDLLDERRIDMTDRSSIDAAIGARNTWAVIDAGQRMTIDQAEDDAQQCFRLHVIRPVTLAEVCAERDLPFVTFSSDLVFDGRQEHPYCEDDPPGPLNVYGASKAEAEQRVRRLSSRALIVRTSAPFGLSGEGTFLQHVLRGLERGRIVTASTAHLMSPTYVPDLVHVVLDLLIDDEHGIWHVANEGAVTWFEFARRVARRTGHDVDAIIPAEGPNAWERAARPRFSALSSRRARLARSLDAAVEAFGDAWSSRQSQRAEARSRGAAAIQMRHSPL